MQKKKEYLTDAEIKKFIKNGKYKKHHLWMPISTPSERDDMYLRPRLFTEATQFQHVSFETGYECLLPSILLK